MDKDKFHFSHACSLHTLQKGQGVVGRAFASYNLVFCKDITQFNITEYPLAHYTRECSFTGCFAICLQESNTGDDVIVLEFFLPPSYTEGGGDPRFILFSLVATMRQHLKSFKVASGEELGDALSVEVFDFSRDDKLDHFQIPQIARSPDRIENGGELASYQQLLQVDAIDTRNNVFTSTEINNIAAATSSQQKCITHPSKRQCRKAGIPISFEDIQKRFGMKLDNAAESLGVSRSTLKRVCQEYNILWWSPSKRNKDNGSLSKKNCPRCC
ncbi:Protein NLP6 [Camellia lanceoleosa]|uniref:Protein NLP6 n=1 Tax=Camellia lanceoleosa TaxID=1840588 RepID=A0ACC0FI55_9ERIC|nr:Protein NLP6 [Camellia lanceoleosa]